MVIWATIMLLNQFVVGAMTGTMGPSMVAQISWDPGMVAIAVLMLISGFIMLQRPADASM